jgi:hypothetical protein
MSHTLTYFVSVNLNPFLNKCSVQKEKNIRKDNAGKVVPEDTPEQDLSV